MDTTQIKKKIVSYAKLAQSRGYTVASEGNISVRLPDNNILITPTRMVKDFISTEDLVVIDIDGNQIEGSAKATSERYTHCEIYKKRTDIQCIIHAHPVYTVLMTVLGFKPFDNVFLSEAAMFLKNVSMARFAKPSTTEGAQVVSEVCADSDVIIIDKHGSFTCGKDLETAFILLEILEKYCRMYYLATLSGKAIQYIDPTIVEELKRVPY